MAAGSAGEAAKRARELEIAEGRSRAEAATRVLQGQLTELRTLLTGTLDQDPYVPFARFKETLVVPDFRPSARLLTPLPAPRRETYLPTPPSGLGAVLPGRRRAYAADQAKGEEDYALAVEMHRSAEQDRQVDLERARAAYEQTVDREQERVRRQHAAVDQAAAGFAEGKRRAVADYFREVLAMQRYPERFPTGVKVAFLPADGELRVDIDLPLMGAIPEFESAEYMPVKKEFKHKKITITGRNELYQHVVAQIALRTLRCAFKADRTTIVHSVICNGFVDTVDTATGLDARLCLVSVQVPRAEFERLNLARLTPVDCLTRLHAKISKTPEKYQPVQPILEYPWDDLPYADELDAAAGLDHVKNLLDLDGFEWERLLLELLRAVPEFDEVRRTREFADGGIDLVAVNKTPFVGGRVAIQAKRYAPHRKVKIDAVREIIGSITQREFTKGIIMTTSGFTPDARLEAERLGVELYDGERMLWLLRHHLHREYTIIGHDRRKPPIKKPPAG